MDYFLFNFSGVQFHYTMSPLKKIIDAPVLTDEGKVTQETKEAVAIGSQCMQDIKKL